MENFEQGYALLVGVGADLPVTVADAKGLHEILADPRRGAYGSNNIHLLVNEQANRANILCELDWLAEQAKSHPDAIVTVFFSGHGSSRPEYHLVPNGYNVLDLTNTAITGREFTYKLRAIHSKKLLVLLDCCYASGMTDAKEPTGEKYLLPPDIQENLAAGAGRVVIASSRKYEVSYIGNPYSIFTQALREGLAGYGSADQDGFAYVGDVAMYVSRVVHQRKDGKQNPVLKFAGADNFAIAYYAGGKTSIKALPDTNTYPSPIDTISDVDMVAGYRKILNSYRKNLLAVEDRMAQFYDQAAVPLDLERAREGILQKISELETKIETEAKTIGWKPQILGVPSITLEALLARIDRMETNLGYKLDHLKTGQIAIYRKLDTTTQDVLERVLSEFRQGRVEQGQIADTLDAILCVLKHIQDIGLPMDAETHKYLDDIYTAVNSSLNFEQQFELSLPVIPFLLDYKVSLGAGVDLGAVWEEFKQRFAKI